MKKRGLRFQKSLSVKIALILTLLGISLLPINVLEIQTEEGTETCSLFLNPEIILEVYYTHSVSLTAVVDIYRINKNGIWAIEERWQQFDAGQPIDFSKIEKGFFIKEMNMFLGKEWSYWFIPLNRASIKLGSKYVFHEIKKEGKVIFRVKRAPFLFTLIN